MLAGPGVVAATYATGALANWLLMPTADGRYFNSSSSGGGSVDIVGLPGEALADGCAADAWTEMAGYVLGVIVSATDPVAVVALLKELGVKAELSIGIEGESLLNDGTALVIFQVMWPLIQLPKAPPPDPLPPDQVFARVRLRVCSAEGLVTCTSYLVPLTSYLLPRTSYLVTCILYLVTRTQVPPGACARRRDLLLKTREGQATRTSRCMRTRPRGAPR